MRMPVESEHLGASPTQICLFGTPQLRNAERFPNAPNGGSFRAQISPVSAPSRWAAQAAEPVDWLALWWCHAMIAIAPASTTR